jgi:CO/xanthine dehydrogenase FAD-binding subunit
MKPPEFRYLAARSIDEAVAALAKQDGDAKVLAGGQSLTPMLNFRLVNPSLLVDINRIQGLDGIHASKDGLKIGALTRHRAIEASSIIRERQPLLAAAAAQVGHLAIRNRGTFGGSIAHNDPAAEFPMVALLLDAKIKAKGATGERSIAAKDFFVSYLATSLNEGEIVTEVEVPDLPAGTGWGFEELSRRLGDFAIAAVCAAVTLMDGQCSAARISMAGVGPKALRATSAEKILAGQKIGDELLNEAAAAARGDADPTNDVHASADFRRHLVEVLTKRALRAACERAGGA